VVASEKAKFEKGDRVFVNGWGLGETHWGCLAGYARLKSEWLLPQPKTLKAADTMAIGTAGYTAMLCALAIERHGTRPGDGELLVTGASGGVGGFAISILSDWGYRVVASTARLEEASYLRDLGAAEVLDRSILSGAGKPLGKERWAAVVDAVGSHTLANACAATRYGGIVAACGLAQGMDFPTTVAPFILRGVTLKGIDSVMAPRETRLEAWTRLDSDLNRDKLKLMTREIALAEALECAPQLMAGKIRGRIVVNTQ
jgi:acrylyl-CoA reductase (NADPH)